MKFLPSDLAHLLDLATRCEERAHRLGEKGSADLAASALVSVTVIRRVVEICQRLNATPAKKSSMAKMSDADFLAFLKSEPAYRGVNIEREEGKMRAWCKANNRQPSRKRLVNWLNRAESPMAQGSEPAACPECPGLPVGKLQRWMSSN